MDKKKAMELSQDPQSFQFSSPAEIIGNQGSRQFSGTAYSGEVIPQHYMWGDVIFDLDNIKIKDNLGVLFDHNQEKRIGIVKNKTVTNEQGIQVSGPFLKNEVAQSIINDADEDFPWEMSVYIDPGSIEFLEEGETIVNGRTVKAPMTIFRNNSIREVSFVVVGYDSYTSAKSFSKAQTEQKPRSEEDDMNELQEAQARAAAAEAEVATLKAKTESLETTLKQFSRENREKEILAIAEKSGREFSKEETEQMHSMQSEHFEFFKKQISVGKTAEEEKPDQSFLFGHKAVNGQNRQGDSDDIDSKFDSWSRS